jgi:hypothetical protein
VSNARENKNRRRRAARKMAAGAWRIKSASKLTGRNLRLAYEGASKRYLDPDYAEWLMADVEVVQ